LSAPSRYRVDFLVGTTIETLGYLADGYAHHSALDPFVSALVREGRAGVVYLIDDSTGFPVARRRVAALGPSARQRPRQRGVSPLLSAIPTRQGEEDPSSPS
jgi:hypothetical protein